MVPDRQWQALAIKLRTSWPEPEGSLSTHHDVPSDTESRVLLNKQQNLLLASCSNSKVVGVDTLLLR